MDRNLIKSGVDLILQGLGVDTNDHNFDRTPERVADVYEEMFCPPDTGYPVFDEKYTDMIMIRGQEMYTMCPHHLLPVKLKIAVAYIPDGKVIGASKLIRMCRDANRYPMTQEALTQAIQEKIRLLTNMTSHGEAVLLEGQHGCFSIRGVRQDGASMVTTRFGGSFKDDVLLQERFIQLARW